VIAVLRATGYEDPVRPQDVAGHGGEEPFQAVQRVGDLVGGKDAGEPSGQRVLLNVTAAKPARMMTSRAGGSSAAARG
jgi:hypothetical protein